MGISGLVECERDSSKGDGGPSDKSLGYFRASLRDRNGAALDSQDAKVHHWLMSDIVLKLWGFCHTLRHDRVAFRQPRGRETIAQRFIAGSWRRRRISPVRDGRN